MCQAGFYVKIIACLQKYYIIMNYKIVFKILLFPSLVYIFNNTFQSLAFDFYIKYSVDTLSHFLGGLSIAYSANYGLSLLEKEKWIIIKKNILRAGIIIGAVTIAAVCWEFYEFISDNFLHTGMQPNLADTIKDLCMGMIGAVVFSATLLYRDDKK